MNTEPLIFEDKTGRYVVTFPQAGPFLLFEGPSRVVEMNRLEATMFVALVEDTEVVGPEVKRCIAAIKDRLQQPEQPPATDRRTSSPGPW